MTCVVILETGNRNVILVVWSSKSFDTSRQHFWNSQKRDASKNTKIGKMLQKGGGVLEIDPLVKLAYRKIYIKMTPDMRYFLIF